ncbi:hypothetical protein C4D60_Mb04t25720 [Musa balbisiana]|uniref:Uncharacterized protein n=1 Tax=Musa balbisiana TaxID=52838 RepID=A0A4S8KES2_MUSBA|nr:hypothetical protein C4D60_Mb04t25720 [Musa balbisiana]
MVFSSEREAGRRVSGGCLLYTLAWRTWRSRKAQGPMGESIKATPKRDEQVRAVEDLGLLNIATGTVMVMDPMMETGEWFTVKTELFGRKGLASDHWNH